jgi:hypothetical protein
MRANAPIRTAAAVLLSTLLTVGLRAQNNNASPRVILVDPTPRPDDLQQKYASNSASDQNAQRIMALRAQNRLLIQRATDMLVQLAKKLKDDVATDTRPSITALSIQRADQIQTLAKIVKERTQQQ